MSKLSLKAKNFAEHAHRDQVRKYSGEPYSAHLREVAGLCAEVGCRDEVIAAAWLHDAKEDQGVTDAELETLFGADVARLVDEVTDRSRPEDGNRQRRKEIDRMHNANASPEGKTIKLADLISNGKDITARDPHFAVAYMREMELLLPLLTEGHPILHARAVAILGRWHNDRKAK
jgi:(p)ppGpp synthase/HD superfamily hydrolase